MNARVVIITPVYRQGLSPAERVSLCHLREHLGGYEKVVLAPEGLSLKGFDDFQIVHFPVRFFRSIAGYNRLMLTRRFYRRFRAYEFMLIYHLDALVFSDALRQWCNSPWDFVGAPIFVGSGHAETDLMCLNGGFSLRRIPAFLRVLGAWDPRRIGAICRGIPFMERNLATRVLKCALVTIHQFGLANVLPLLVQRSTCHEDVVWTRFAMLFDPRFRVAPASVAWSFAFEKDPSLLFEQNHCELPFGCHAWERWDAGFWALFVKR